MVPISNIEPIIAVHLTERIWIKNPEYRGVMIVSDLAVV